MKFWARVWEFRAEREFRNSGQSESLGIPSRAKVWEFETEGGNLP